MLNKPTVARLIKVFFWGAVISLGLLITQLGHCAISKTSKNSLGVVTYAENPYIYEAGTIAEVSNVSGNLNLRFRPLATYALYDEDILFCGLPTEKFSGVGETMLLTYERRAHRLVNEVACHNLMRVDTVTLGAGLR